MVWRLCKIEKVFDKLNIKFTEIDIDFDKDGYEIAKKLQNQNPRIPTIVFEDGSYLVEPSDVEPVSYTHLTLPTKRIV